MISLLGSYKMSFRFKDNTKIKTTPARRNEVCHCQQVIFINICAFTAKKPLA